MLCKSSLFIFFFLSIFWADAQKIFVKSYNINYSVLERDAFGNNPLTLAPFIKNKTEYQNSINSFTYNGIYGNPAIEKIKVLTAGIEISKRNNNGFFWKNFTVKAGIGISGKILKEGMGLSNDYAYVYDTVNFSRIKSQYWINHATRELSVSAGLAYRIKIAKHINFATGLIFQPNLLVLNKYSRNIDSMFFPRYSGPLLTKSSQLSTLKGNQIFSYNVSVPLTIEINVYKEKFWIQSGLLVGFLFNKYYTPEKRKEANGLQLSIVYQPKKNTKLQ